MESRPTILEGFLCPICMQDLGSFHNLHNHFETSHTAEDKALFDQIKGLFTKAKGRILGREEFAESSSSRFTTPQHLVTNLPVWEPQEFGITRSHVEAFKKIRDYRIDRFVIESNKVLIRLDKLFSQIKLSGKENAKEYEKTLVPWVKDSDVPFCPTCGDKFNVTRRKHHCRLCGAIMCSRCSLFVSYELADELVESLKRPTSARVRSHSINLPNATRSAPNHLQIRSCHDCYKILLQRKNKTTERSSHQLLVLLYEKLQSAIQSANKSSPEYQRMAVSLHQGEEDFDLEQANKMRFALMKYYETIDVISKKIAALDTNDEENPPSANELRLQESIRQFAHAYLQENMLTLQSLPSVPKLQTLRKQRRQQQEKKRREQLLVVERERAEAKRLQELERLQRDNAAAERKLKTVQKKPAAAKPAQFATNKGWSSTGIRSRRESLREGEEPDPLQEQIDNVQQMLKQAEEANRSEEAASLKLNLIELKEEYKKRVARAFVSERSIESPSSSSSGFNPFLDDSEVNMQKMRNVNPFLSSDDDDSRNPFLHQNYDDTNSFIERKATNREGTNPFMQEPDSSERNNPILHQINYVKQCLDIALKSGETDEAAMLKENLRELNSLYNAQ